MGQQRKRLGLALGGGGARGLAHVGVIQVLEREGIPVDCIAGTSVGSLVGAACAAGLRGDDLLELALRARWRDFVSLTWPRDGFLSFAKMEAFLIDQVGDLGFADLETPYAAVAADLASGELVVLTEGRLAPAVRASCSVPGFVTPLEWQGRCLVDGALANNLPISVVRNLGADVIVAVGLATPSNRRPRGQIAAGVAAIEHLLIHAGDDPATADVYLPIPFWGLGSLLRLSHRQESIELGRRAAKDTLPAIHAALGESEAHA